jgi:riboflavin biosynthesis pyrimidine reductase
MKLLTKLSFIAAAVAAVGSGAAFADDPQLQNRLAAQNAQDSSRTSNSPTVALYSTRNAINNGAAQDERSQVRFELQSNPHG